MKLLLHSVVPQSSAPPAAAVPKFLNAYSWQVQLRRVINRQHHVSKSSARARGGKQARRHGSGPPNKPLTEEAETGKDSLSAK